METIRDRHATIGVSIVQSIRKKNAVRSQEFDGFLVIVVELDFQLDRVRPQINEPALRAVLGARNGSTMEVNDQRRRVVKLHHLSLP